MDKVSFIDIPNGIIDGTTTYAIIDRGNGEFTSMTKEYYDAQQANSTPSVSVDPLATADAVSPSPIVP